MQQLGSTNIYSPVPLPLLYNNTFLFAAVTNAWKRQQFCLFCRQSTSDVTTIQKSYINDATYTHTIQSSKGVTLLHSIVNVLSMFTNTTRASHNPF